MGFSDWLLSELDHENAVTRVVLERVPAECHDWRPHPRSCSLGQLTVHIPTLPLWMANVLDRTEFDLNPPDEAAIAAPPFQSVAHVLSLFDANAVAARARLARASDAELMVPWTLKSGGRSMFSMPRVSVLRSFMFNHGVHHRGQLSVYLRMLDVPLPNMYGPTADSKLTAQLRIAPSRT